MRLLTQNHGNRCAELAQTKIGRQKNVRQKDEEPEDVGHRHMGAHFMVLRPPKRSRALVKTTPRSLKTGEGNRFARGRNPRVALGSLGLAALHPRLENSAALRLPESAGSP